MLDPTIFFYVTLAAVVFLAASFLTGGRRGARRGRRGHGRGRRGRGPGFSLWSFNTVFLFAAGFGIGGFFASSAALGTGPTLAAGTAAGALLTALDYVVLRSLYGRQGSSAINIEDYIGRTGSVEISIIGNGVGRIRCQRDGSTATLLARSSGGDLPVNSLVRVSAVLGSIAVVEAAEAAETDGFPTWRGRNQ